MEKENFDPNVDTEVMSLIVERNMLLYQLDVMEAYEKRCYSRLNEIAGLLDDYDIAGRINIKEVEKVLAS